MAEKNVDAAPVAWRWRQKDGNPDFWHLTNINPANQDIAYWRSLDLPKYIIQPLYAHPSDAAPQRDDDKPLAENTETICLEIVKVLGIANFDIHSYEQSFDLLNCVAAYAMRCEEDGRSFQRLIDRVKSMEVKNGFEPDRRASHPKDASIEDK